MRIEHDGSSREAVARDIAGAAALLAPGFGPTGPTDTGGSLAIIERFAREAGEQPGIGYVRDLARAQQAQADDGIVTAVILAAVMVGRAMEALAAGADPGRLTAGIEAARDEVLAEIRGRATQVEAIEQIAAVVTTALSAPALGELLAETFDMVGKDGVITVEPSGRPGLKVALSEGYAVDSGYVVADGVVSDDAGQEAAEVVVREPLVLVIDDEIRDATGFASVAGQAVGQAAEAGRPLVVFTAGVPADGPGVPAASGIGDSVVTVVVAVPGFADQRAEILGDIAAVTGATFTPAGGASGRAWGRKRDRAGAAGLGGARKAVVTRDHTVIVAGDGRRPAIGQRIDQIRKQMEARRTPLGDFDRLQRRLARLAGGVATLRVGGATEIETARLVAEAERGPRLVRLAIDQGISPGGGAALADAGLVLGELHHGVPGGLSGDEAAGARIVLDSLTAPLRQLAVNAGIPAAAVDPSVSSRPAGTGFDPATGETVPMLPLVVDVLPVIHAAVTNATALASHILLG